MTNNAAPATAPCLPNSRRAVLRSLLAGAAAIVPAAGAMALPAQSEALRLAIAAHRVEQAKVDNMHTPAGCSELEQDEYEDAFGAACDVAEAALREVAETPCSSDADFFTKLFYLLEDEKRDGGGLFSHDETFGKLAFAVEMHLEQRAA